MADIERRSQTDAVVAELKRFFLAGGIEVGGKLPTEKQLCETYRVGRSTIREAIRTLQVMGYVELKPGRGAFLASRTMSAFDAALLAWSAEHKPGFGETLRMRLTFAVLGVRFAIEKGTDADLARIDLARLAFEQGVIRGCGGEELSGLDDAYHRSIVVAGQSELLGVLDPVVGTSYGEWRERALRFEEYAQGLVVPYQRITLAVLARDVELAELQTRRHYERVTSDMLLGLERRGTRE